MYLPIVANAYGDIMECIEVEEEEEASFRAEQITNRSLIMAY